MCLLQSRTDVPQQQVNNDSNSETKASSCKHQLTKRR